MTPAIFFLSDYGHRDEFVGVVHAVLQRLAPDTRVVDLGHEVAPFDVTAGARMLVRAVPFCGPGVVLAVVDPGVGTCRRGVAIEVVGDPGAAGHPVVAHADRPATAPVPVPAHAGGPTWLVGPDNGLLLPAAAALGGIRRAVGLAGVSTFDGRDVFAPAAAALVVGRAPELFGDAIDPEHLVRSPDLAAPSSRPPDAGRRPDPSTGAVTVAVTWIDTFGNVQLDCRPEWLGRAIGIGSRLTLTTADEGGPPGSGPAGRWTVRHVRAFGDLADGELGLLVDGNGQLAIVANRASAARILGLEGRPPVGAERPMAPPEDRTPAESVAGPRLRLVFP
ncbi:MAG: SAM-dependent chlorinase/fluorinase [Actinomycetota bacterium]|nr:SAM-dependent chlorinase/fluorinase [Actinomycetota bacterium]